jgi:hypothetical protein
LTRGAKDAEEEEAKPIEKCVYVEAEKLRLDNFISLLLSSHNAWKRAFNAIHRVRRRRG